MRIPTREEFAPLPEAVARFGLPDPLAVLPQLENQLEAVVGATTQVREVAAAFAVAADDLETEAAAVAWDGEAAEQFRSTIATTTASLRATSETLSTAADSEDGISDDIKDIIKDILLKIISVLGVVAAILALIYASPAIATGALIGLIVGLISAVLFFIYAWLDQLIWIVQNFHEFVRRLIEEARRLWEELRDRLRDRGDRGDPPIWVDPVSPAPPLPRGPGR